MTYSSMCISLRLCKIKTFIWFSTVIFHITFVFASPIVFPVTSYNHLVIPHDFCILPRIMDIISRTARVLTNMSISLTQAQDIKSTGHILYITIISNELCQDLMNYNITNNPDVREETIKDLPDGLNSGILCATGSCVSCGDEDPRNKTFKVDAGGPLTLLDKRQRTTLVGIGSGGVQR